MCRDINPYNVMVTKIIDSDLTLTYKATLIDFNVAKRFRDLDNKDSNPIMMMTNTGN